MSDFSVKVANESHLDYVDLICLTIAESAAQRGTGIARRSPEYISGKIMAKPLSPWTSRATLEAFAISRPGGMASMWPTAGSLFIPNTDIWVWLTVSKKKLSSYLVRNFPAPRSSG